MSFSLLGPIRNFVQDVHSRTLKSRFKRDSAASLILRILYSICYGVANILLARILGAADYGAFTYATAWLTLLGIPAVLGMDRFLVREVAAYRVQGAWGKIRGLVRQADQAVFWVSVAIGLVAAAVAWMLPGRSGSTMQSTFWIALVALPFYSLKRVRQAALQGLQRVVPGALPEMLITPVFLVLVIALEWRFLGPFHASWAMAVLVLAHVIGFLVAMWLLKYSLPGAGSGAAIDSKLPWGRSLLPLVFLSSVSVIYGQADILVLGAMKGARAVGYYGVADRNAELVNFLLMAVGLPLAPLIANIHARGDMQHLERAVTKLAQVTFFVSLLVASAFILFGYWWLLLLYGPSFTQGRWPLAILSAGQLATAWTGPSTILLTMTGHERDAARAIFLSAAVNIALCIALIPKWGPEGAAIAAASSAVVWSVLLAKAVRRNLGIHVSVLGTIAFPSQLAV